MPSQYGDPLKAKAQAMWRQGETGPTIAATLNVPLRTVQHWAFRWREIAETQDDRELLNNELRIALQANALIMDSLDELAERDPEELPKHLTSLNVTKGVAVDKFIKFKQLNSPSQDNRQLVIVLPGLPQPLTIDAPATQLPEPDPEDSTG